MRGRSELGLWSPLLALLLILPGVRGAPVAAQRPTPAPGPTLAWDAGVRPRTETRSAGERELWFNSMRTQLGLRAGLAPDLRLYVQIRDYRYWGGDQYFDPAADALDLMEGYFELGHRGESPLWARVGRQKVDLANGRLVGDPVWTQFGRAFDGVRTTVRLGEGTVVDGLGMQLRESLVAGDRSDATLWGLWGAHSFADERSLQLFWLHDRDGDDPETARSTVGVYHDGSVGPLGLRLEGAWQTGRAQGFELRKAYLVAGALTLPLGGGRGSVAAGYDRYSGSAAPDEGTSQAFSDLYGRNHRFLGFADLFLDIPRDTGGRGLQDFRTQLRWGLPWAGQVELALHHFRVADPAGLDSGALADEVDLTLFWPGLMDGALEVQSGVSWAALGAAGEALDVAPGDVFFGYLMVEAAIFGAR